MQRDGVATGSPLSPVNAGIFVIELEKKILPKVLQCMKAWKQYMWMAQLPILNQAPVIMCYRF